MFDILRNKSVNYYVKAEESIDINDDVTIFLVMLKSVLEEVILILCLFG